MNIEKLVLTKFEQTLPKESDHTLRLLTGQLDWSLQEMRQNCGGGTEAAKLARLLSAFREGSTENEGVLENMDAYWREFLWYSPGSEYAREGEGAINSFGGFMNDGFRAAVIEQAQVRLARVTTVMADSLGMVLWLAEGRREGDYAEKAIEAIAEASLDYYHRTSPNLEYYGRLGENESFRDTDIGLPPECRPRTSQRFIGGLRNPQPCARGGRRAGHSDYGSRSARPVRADNLRQKMGSGL